MIRLTPDFEPKGDLILQAQENRVSAIRGWKERTAKLPHPQFSHFLKMQADSFCGYLTMILLTPVHVNGSIEDEDQAMCMSSQSIISISDALECLCAAIRFAALLSDSASFLSFRSGLRE